MGEKQAKEERKSIESCKGFDFGCILFLSLYLQSKLEICVPSYTGYIIKYANFIYILMMTENVMSWENTCTRLDWTLSLLQQQLLLLLTAFLFPSDSICSESLE